MTLAFGEQRGAVVSTFYTLSFARLGHLSSFFVFICPLSVCRPSLAHRVHQWSDPKLTPNPPQAHAQSINITSLLYHSILQISLARPLA